MKRTGQAVKARLFAEPGASVYAVLDGASVPDLLEKLYAFEPEYECLYLGELKPDLAHVAPYLVRLEPGSPVCEWIIEHGWGNHWGIFALAAAGLREMRQHFRRFLIVHTEDGAPLYFRYYDPRVLAVYLPTCNASELAAIFGPVTTYLAEGKTPQTIIRFGVESGALVRKEEQLS